MLDRAVCVAVDPLMDHCLEYAMALYRAFDVSVLIPSKANMGIIWHRLTWYGSHGGARILPKKVLGIVISLWRLTCLAAVSLIQVSLLRLLC